VFKSRRLLCHPTLGLRVVKKKKKTPKPVELVGRDSGYDLIYRTIQPFLKETVSAARWVLFLMDSVNKDPHQVKLRRADIRLPRNGIQTSMARGLSTKSFR
jgi:hypothetical protein